MPPRVRRHHRKEPEVVLGGLDPMSQLAKVNQLPLCGQHDAFSPPTSTRTCTRARGHDEDGGSKHVVAPSGVIERIWEAAP